MEWIGSQRAVAGLLPLLLALAAAGCAERTQPVDHSAIAERSAPVADAFQAALQAELKAALQQGGPIAATSVCKEAAPAIALAQSESSGAEVRRVALRNRNPEARVPADMRVHYDALARAPVAAGRPASRVWISTDSGRERAHYMRAIPMQDQPCALCHGSDVAPELAEHIRTLYPEDRATGFAAGEMRGAIVISWPMSSFRPAG